MILEFLVVLNCLADLKPYERDLKRYLPGNASNFAFSQCVAQSVEGGGRVDAKGKWKISQQTCIGSFCKTIWSYSGEVFSRVNLNENCEVTAADVWTVPQNRLLDPLLEQATEKIKTDFAKVFREKPEYRQICEPKF